MHRVGGWYRAHLVLHGARGGSMNRFGVGMTRRGFLVGAAVSVAVLPLKGAEARAPKKPSVAPRGSAITLKPSSRPLGGVIVGRKVPPFSYKARDGKTITRETYRGKAVLLDVWSVT